MAQILETDDEAERGLREFVESARSSPAGSGSEGRKWRRDDLYESRTARHTAKCHKVVNGVDRSKLRG
jgi:hypothetical protein